MQAKEDSEEIAERDLGGQSWNIQGAVRERSRNIQGTFRKEALERRTGGAGGEDGEEIAERDLQKNGHLDLAIVQVPEAKFVQDGTLVVGRQQAVEQQDGR